jgi:serine/threonine protein kinase
MGGGGRQVTGALRYMHSKRIMHRDVKPANVLVTSTGLKLGDLGLGRHFSDNTHEAFSKVCVVCVTMRPGATL